jgi:hypothetical protein
VSYDAAAAVAVDVNGHIYVGGSVWGALPAQAQVGGQDAFVRKYDPNGNEQWTRQFGTAALDDALAVTVDVSANAYVAGFVEGALPGHTGDGRDGFLLKVSAPGAATTATATATTTPTAALTATPTPTATSTPTGTATRTPTPTATRTATVTPAPTATVTPNPCSPRPPVSVSVAPNGDGRLRVVVVPAGNPAVGPPNALVRLRFGEPRASQNAVVEIVGGASGITDSHVHTPPAGTQSVTFFVGRQTASQPTTVHLIAVDGCGEWPTFVGGGPGAF